MIGSWVYICNKTSKHTVLILHFVELKLYFNKADFKKNRYWGKKERAKESFQRISTRSRIRIVWGFKIAILKTRIQSRNICKSLVENGFQPKFLYPAKQ